MTFVVLDLSKNLDFNYLARAAENILPGETINIKVLWEKNTHTNQIFFFKMKKSGIVYLVSQFT